MTASTPTTDAGSPLQREKAEVPLPQNAWGVAGLVIKTLGDNATLILVGGALVFAIYMFMDQNQRHRREQQAAVSAATAEAQKQLTDANARLTGTYKILLEQSGNQVKEMTAFMNLRKDVSNALVEEQSRLRDALRETATADETKRAAEVQLAKLKEALEKARHDIELTQGQVENVTSWGALFRLSTLAGRIAASSDPAKPRSYLVEMNALEMGELQSDVRPLIEKLEQAVKAWENGPAPDAVRNATIAVANKCKELFSKAPPVLASIVTELRRELYAQAIAVTRRLAQSNNWNQSEEDRAEFTSLYHGRLIMVESSDVATAMVKYRGALEAWQAEQDASKHQQLKAERARLAENLEHIANRETELPP